MTATESARVERPVTREKHTVSLPEVTNVGAQKQTVAGRTLGPATEQAWVERWVAKLPPLSKDARDRIALLFLAAAAPKAVAS